MEEKRKENQDIFKKNNKIKDKKTQNPTFNNSKNIQQNFNTGNQNYINELKNNNIPYENYKFRKIIYNKKIQKNIRKRRNAEDYENTKKCSVDKGKKVHIPGKLSKNNYQDSTQKQSNQLNYQNNNKNNNYNHFIKNNKIERNSNKTILENENNYNSKTKNDTIKNRIENNIKNDFQKNNKIIEKQIVENKKLNSNHNLNNNRFKKEHIQDFNEIEDKNSENFKNQKKGSNLISSLIYGLIFGFIGTLLLWCKDKKFRKYLKICYKNINYKSIINFLKYFLHPIELIKSIINNIENYKKILKECLNLFYQIIDDYSDIIRLLTLFMIIIFFWLIVKKIYQLIRKYYKKRKKKKKKIK